MASDLIDQWKRDAAAPFEGWDFSYLNGRMVEGEPPWSYLDLAKAAVGGAHDILDIATGGGEVLASLAPFPGRATAVEGYVPNIAVARRRLEPLGVEVFQGDESTGLPFGDEAFDLVLNRHGGFEAAEICRILKPGGMFLTQQVGGDNLADLVASFGARLTYVDNTLARVCADLTALGCHIQRSEEWHGPVTFTDVGALVYFLKAIPWVIEDFEVEPCRDVLESLHREVQTGRPLQFTYSRFLVQAVKG